MPLKRIALKPDSQPPQEQEEVEVRAELNPVEPQAMKPGRPHQAFVENEARKYWLEETGQFGNLMKPTQQEIRAAAMPTLCRALRNRVGSRRHHAVAGMVQHVMDRGWIKPPFSEARESPSYIEALIELARDAGWFTSLEAARDALISEIVRRYKNHDISPLVGDQLMVAVWSVKDVIMLCKMFGLLTRLQRQRDRARRLRVDLKELDAWATVFHADAVDLELDAQPLPADVIVPAFALGEKHYLDATAVESEIKQCLRAFCHPFVGLAVNDLEFGRGTPVAGHPGLLHASAGITGLGDCSLFYHVNENQRLITIVGIGYHLGRDKYRLEYASEELGVRGCIDSIGR